VKWRREEAELVQGADKRTWAVSHSYIRLNCGLQHETEKHAS